MNAIQSLSIQLSATIINYLFKAGESNVKTMFGCDIHYSILPDKAFQSY